MEKIGKPRMLGRRNKEIKRRERRGGRREIVSYRPEKEEREEEI